MKKIRRVKYIFCWGSSQLSSFLHTYRLANKHPVFSRVLLSKSSKPYNSIIQNTHTLTSPSCTANPAQAFSLNTKKFPSIAVVFPPFCAKITGSPTVHHEWEFTPNARTQKKKRSKWLSQSEVTPIQKTASSNKVSRGLKVILESQTFLYQMGNIPFALLRRSQPRGTH